MSTADDTRPISDDETGQLFSGLKRARGLVLAVSGGPDSTALLLLISRWRKMLRTGPAVIAVTVDHGLRPESRREAAAAKRVAKQCGLAHRTVRWSGAKPKTRLQEMARAARYRLLADMAARFGADHVLTAHTRDDQAETVLIRMSRGSGLTGLAGMAARAPLPDERGITLARPLLEIGKARLLATLAESGLSFAQDPSNHNPHFARVRIRALMPELAREGLDAACIARLARRLRRADAAIEASVDAAWRESVEIQVGPPARVAFGSGFAGYPAEVQLRLLRRAIALAGTEGPAELSKLETLHAALAASRVRRTLAGAVVTLDRGRLSVAAAPARRQIAAARRSALRSGKVSTPQSGQRSVGY